MDVIYYYYYLFYKNVLTVNWPHETTIFVLGFSEGFFFGIFIDAMASMIFRVSFGIYLMVGTFIVTWGVNYLYFNHSGRIDRIVMDKPKFYNDHRLSQIISVIFFVVTASSLFWGPVLSRYVHDIYCK
jgi:hypothetical protein